MVEKENDFIKFWLDDGILFSTFTKPVNGTMEVIKGVIDLRHEISNNQKQYWCYDFKGIKSYEKAARDYADEHGQDFLYACAAVVNSHITTFILNAFMKLKNPKVPLRAFKRQEDAVRWLKELKKQNEKKQDL